MTRVLLLDVMGTLVHDPFYTELPAFFGLGLDELLRQKHPGSWLDYEYGRRGEQAFLDDFFADRRAYDQAGLRRAMFAAYRYLDGILPLLEELRRAGVEMHLVSRRDQEVHLGGEVIRLREGEAIVSEHCHKYTLGEFAAMGAAAGLETQGLWLDREERYSLHLLGRAGPGAV